MGSGEGSGVGENASSFVHEYAMSCQVWLWGDKTCMLSLDVLGCVWIIDENGKTH